ncbi:MAG: putative bifunctional tRNA threonylcarbamoyladenosine biosynthesis protein [Candidatus Heimdallarchaeota archaeon LC_2]|nr:MAG: putative bifunctional tRNA threonylcarbamoyladenosine biosynthesis protein [Candidatus Heimdallarchaeota archaeon LC_2]
MALSLPNLLIEEEIAQGAEARISAGTYFDYPVVIKHRYAKTYRNVGIDNKLRKERTIKEVRLLQSARELGLNVPYVLDVDKKEWIIIMDRLTADPIKFRLEDKDLLSYFYKIGEMIATLHTGGIVHGDLTTSNLFVDNNCNVWLIDFGLGFNTKNIEDFAVDNLVLKHILESSHPLIYEKAFESFMDAYTRNFAKGKQIVKRMKVVELRVRYRSH